MITFGERLRELRKSAGLTQAALAKKVSLSKQNLYKYEGDYDYPSILKLHRICEALDITESEFFEGVEIY